MIAASSKAEWKPKVTQGDRQIRKGSEMNDFFAATLHGALVGASAQNEAIDRLLTWIKDPIVRNTGRAILLELVVTVDHAAGWAGDFDAEIRNMLQCTIWVNQVHPGFHDVDEIGLPNIELAQHGIQVVQKYSQIVMRDVLAKDRGELPVGVGVSGGGAGTGRHFSVHQFPSDSRRVFAQ